MRLDIIILVLSALVFVYGDEQISKVFAKRDFISGLYERQSTCGSGEIACSAAEGGGCCPIDTICSTTACVSETTVGSCVASGDQLCGDSCCVSPLVCEQSTLQCVQGSTNTHTGKSVFGFSCWFQGSDVVSSHSFHLLEAWGLSQLYSRNTLSNFVLSDFP